MSVAKVSKISSTSSKSFGGVTPAGRSRTLYQ